MPRLVSSHAQCRAFLLMLLGSLALFAPVLPCPAQTSPLGYGILHTFQAPDSANRNPDGEYPYSGLTPGGDGYLYGVGYSGGTSGSGTIFKVRLDGSGFQTLYSFSALSSASSYSNPDGARPFGTLLPSSDGFFYGTAEQGGANASGTLFKNQSRRQRLCSYSQFQCTEQRKQFRRQNSI